MQILVETAPTSCGTPHPKTGTEENGKSNYQLNIIKDAQRIHSHTHTHTHTHTRTHTHRHTFFFLGNVEHSVNIYKAFPTIMNVKEGDGVECMCVKMLLLA